ncbi:hypothetical protein CEXT_383671 [Caerostris extrusa]|uniref:Uncharacterized protein n=1 Tax=Caerostris extrusa TaxID=172846 RepID=A0AAV4MRR3_CAEEX|nr:hypothetical protein CEXT_383671 [Caerostris extrusa]
MAEVQYIHKSRYYDSLPALDIVSIRPAARKPHSIKQSMHTHKKAHSQVRCCIQKKRRKNPNPECSSLQAFLISTLAAVIWTSHKFSEMNILEERHTSISHGMREQHSLFGSFKKGNGYGIKRSCNSPPITLVGTTASGHGRAPISHNQGGVPSACAQTPWRRMAEAHETPSQNMINNLYTIAAS